MKYRQGAAFYMKPYLRVALLAFIMVSLCILLFKIMSGRESGDAIYGLTLVFVAISLAPFFLSWTCRPFDIFELGYVGIALYFIAYGFPVIWSAYAPQYDLVGQDRFTVVAIIVVLTGLLFFLFGYFGSGISKYVIRSFPKVPIVWNGSRVKLAILLLLGIGWLARFYIIYYYGLFFNDVVGLREEVSQFSGVFSQLSALARLGLVLFSVLVLYQDPGRPVGNGWRVLFGLTVVAEALYFALQGVKGGIIITLLIPVVAYHYLRSKLGIKGLTSTLAILLVVFRVVGAYRAMGSISGNPMESAMSLSESLFIFHAAIVDTIKGQESFGDFLTSLIAMAGGRLSHLSILSTVISQMPEAVGFQYGRTFLVIINAFIPRFIWPDRPKGIFSNEFARQFGFNPSDLISVTNFSMIEELYINFHVLGVAFGMFILGIFLKAAYGYLIVAKPVSPLRILVYILVIQLLFGLFDLPLSSALLSLPREMVIVLSVLFFIRRRRRALQESPNEPSAPYGYGLRSGRSW